nr:MAG TPA: hypothetical protein [Caudoviricetes sp.]
MYYFLYIATIIIVCKYNVMVTLKKAGLLSRANQP